MSYVVVAVMATAVALAVLVHVTPLWTRLRLAAPGRAFRLSANLLATVVTVLGMAFIVMQAIAARNPVPDAGLAFAYCLLVVFALVGYTAWEWFVIRHKDPERGAWPALKVAAIPLVLVIGVVIATGLLALVAWALGRVAGLVPPL